ncbi:MAG: response regulator [Vicinamibacterales bacterium]
MNILIVDDSRMMRMKLKGIITSSGLTIGAVHEANHGKEGLEVLSANAVDVVFTDINMPEMDGRAFLREMRDKGIATQAFKVVCTTEGVDALKDEFATCGVNLYVEKPFQPDVVKAALGEVAKRVKLAQSA